MPCLSSAIFAACSGRSAENAGKTVCSDFDVPVGSLNGFRATHRTSRMQNGVTVSHGDLSPDCTPGKLHKSRIHSLRCLDRAGYCSFSRLPHVHHMWTPRRPLEVRAQRSRTGRAEKFRASSKQEHGPLKSSLCVGFIREHRRQPTDTAKLSRIPTAHEKTRLP